MSDGHRKSFRWMNFLAQMFGDPKLQLIAYPQPDGSVYYEYRAKFGSDRYYFHVHPDGRAECGLRADGLTDIYT